MFEMHHENVIEPCFSQSMAKQYLKKKCIVSGGLFVCTFNSLLEVVTQYGRL